MANYFTHLAFDIPATAEDAARFNQAIEEAALVGSYGGADDDDELDGIACRFDSDRGTLAIFDSDGSPGLSALAKTLQSLFPDKLPIGIHALEDRYVFTYLVTRASTTDFRTFTRHGIIFCPENKDVVLFPEQVGGSFVAIHRPVCGTPFTRPEMWVARSPDLLHWGAHAPLALSGGAWQSGRVGAGPPPVRVADGWLAIYHGNRHPTRAGEVGSYYGGALLLDATDPTRVLKRTAEPFMQPEADFERAGFVPNVVFPTGVVQDGANVLVYYGAADAVTAVAEFELRELMEAMSKAA